MEKANSALPVFADHEAPLAAMLKAARAAGADSADASISETESLAVGVRLGQLEDCEQSGGGGLSLRVFVTDSGGQKSASVSTNDLRTLDGDALETLARRAVAIARAGTADPYAGLAEPAQWATHDVPLDLDDPSFELDMAALRTAAETVEGAALAVPGIANSNGGNASASRTRFTLMTQPTSGAIFAASAAETSFSLSAAVIAAEANGEGQVIDYDFSSAAYQSDLRGAEEIGAQAAAYALRQLGGVKAPTMADIPVIFDPRTARSLLSHFLNAISGTAVAQGRSFLAGRLGEQIFADDVMVLDEPHLPRGLRSRAFDSEGLPTCPLPFVQNGKLNYYLMGLKSARQLNLPPLGHGSGASNVCFAPGNQSPAELLRGIRRGIYVTDLMGNVNLITGDYSRGIAGLMIEDGELAGAVNEVTIAGTLQQMFRSLSVANDLVRTTGVDSPTVRVEGMTLAGS